MRRLRRAALLGTLTATVAALAAPVHAGVVTVGTVAAEAPPRAPVTGTPTFTDPWWLPVRHPARVSCVRTNCHRPGRGRNHGHWAIDFLGRRGDPVNAAGYGIAHVGGRASGCRGKRGNWVWVDHGAAEVTAYFHLDSIAVGDGQVVTPATMLGRMGTTGTCGTDYLHFERRSGGLRGDYRYPVIAAACVRNRPRLLPYALGYRNWDRLPIRPRRVTVWSGGVSCTSAPSAPAPPSGLHVVKQSGVGAQLAWNPAWAGARYAIMVEPFRRRTATWRPPKYQFTKRTRVVVRGLRPRWTYRFRIAVDGPLANSTWSEPVVVTLR